MQPSAPPSRTSPIRVLSTPPPSPPYLAGFPNLTPPYPQSVPPLSLALVTLPPFCVCPFTSSIRLPRSLSSRLYRVVCCSTRYTLNPTSSSVTHPLQPLLRSFVNPSNSSSNPLPPYSFSLVRSCSAIGLALSPLVDEILDARRFKSRIIKRSYYRGFPGRLASASSAAAGSRLLSASFFQLSSRAPPSFHFSSFPILSNLSSLYRFHSFRFISGDSTFYSGALLFFFSRASSNRLDRLF